MKTRKTILLTVAVIVLSSLTSLMAMENKAIYNAKKSLHKELNLAVSKVPFQDYLRVDKSNKVELIFNVDKNQVLQNIVVKGPNKELVQVTQTILNNTVIHADEILVGERCRVKLTYYMR